MRKFAIVVLFVMILLPVSLFAQTNDYGFIHGDWRITGSRAYQNDAHTSIAKAWIEYPQKGVVEYNFNVRFEEGFFEDGHAGFGLHIFVDKPSKGFSWGEGNSYLIWMNYDRNPVSDKIPKGLSAQIYRSEANWQMELVQSYSLAALEKVMMSFPMDTLVPIRIVADGRTGMLKVYDPVDSSIYYPIKLDNKRPLEGNYVTLRTNSGAFSFGY